MRILIDIGHPGHVHYFKNTIKQLEEKNYKFKIIARDREFVKELLENLDLPFVNRGKGKNSLFGKFLYMLKADFQMLKESLMFKPDMFLSFTSLYASHVSFLLNKPHIALNDTEHSDKFNKIVTYPFCSIILTPNSYKNNLGRKQIRFNNVVEGLYLHKKYFKKNSNIRNDLNLKDNEEYVIFRFVSWNAHHDIGEAGLDIKTTKDLINLLGFKYRIFISSEGELPEEFKQYKISISPEKMHDVLAYASIFIGESATMASESALLGTSAVYINSLPLLCNIKIGQEAGLIKHFQSSHGVVDYVSRLLKYPNIKNLTKEKSEIMQKDFINPTNFLVWFIQEYPSSFEIMKKTPDYQLKFK